MHISELQTSHFGLGVKQVIFFFFSVEIVSSAQILINTIACEQSHC